MRGCTPPHWDTRLAVDLDGGDERREVPLGYERRGLRPKPRRADLLRILARRRSVTSAASAPCAGSGTNTS
jgi:hypothetical protein